MSDIKKILYVHYGENWIRGSEQCLLDLIVNLDRTRFEPLVWTNNLALTPLLVEQNIAYLTDDFPLLLGWQKPSFDLKSWAQLVKKGQKIIKQNDIALVHANSGAPCQWMALASKLCRCPMVTHLHSDYLSRDRVTLGLHMSPHIITASDAISHSLRQDGYPEEQLTVIHNGINIDALQSQTEVDIHHLLGLNADDVIFTTVGSLIQRKGVDRIIQALRYLTLEYPNSHLVVIGEGEQKQQLIQLAQEMHLSAHVHFVGEQHNVAGWLKGSDAFVSGARQEAFGLVITEAAVAKTPIIAPFEGGIPEIVQHSESALLYVNQGYAPLLNMMRCIHSHQQDCQQFAQRAHDVVCEHFNHQRYVEDISNLYQHLLATKPSGSTSILNNIKPVISALRKHRQSSKPSE
ncbi:putative galactosyltransferase [Vibrio ichthyoenteri ATCC 700023]|uniref:Putative galactosyltransferase n=1 Tax=Vibrio ichthyoenteri ATCC 700023 TaxID=870968 RepID=F9RXR5_9VIBR|nr:glycosyltransferase [Vibrio ichthyoenteri]EGU47606.1 putative galactosyltransferase [Vibrio ichthyoenteri ATCC 700023]